MKTKCYFPALMGLNSPHTERSGTIVLLSYNASYRPRYECGHISDAARVYRCPPELVEQAKRLQLLASTDGMGDVLLFDQNGRGSRGTGTGYRITQTCPACTFEMLLRTRPACALCNSQLLPGRVVYLVHEESIRKIHVNGKTQMPAGALRLSGRKPHLLCCDAPKCRRLARGCESLEFDPRIIESRIERAQRKTKDDQEAAKPRRRCTISSYGM